MVQITSSNRDSSLSSFDKLRINLHLRIKVFTLLFVSEIRDKLFDGFHHLSLGKVVFGKDGLELLEEGIPSTSSG